MMSTDEKVQPIWDMDGGIKDFELDPCELAVSEIPGIRESWREQRDQLKGTQQLPEFIERLGREWAIETGVIENLYEIDHGVTQTLIEHGFQAELLQHGSTNKPRGYVLQLLGDQKEVLDGVFDFVKSDRELTTSYIKELHAALLRNQKTTEGIDTIGQHVDIPILKGVWKEQENDPIRDGIKYTYCPPEHVGSEMDRLIELHSRHIEEGISGEVQAAWLHHRFTQIHPFQDGNGRVARAIASLVLIKDGLFPLVITRDDRKRYIEALEAADRGDLSPLVKIFVRSQSSQFKKASEVVEDTYSETRSTESALKILQQAAEIYQSRVRRKILQHAKAIQEDIKSRFDQLCPDIENALGKVYQSSVSIEESKKGTEHFFSSQIVSTANRLDYYANRATYQSWISLQMYWSHRARLVFSIHGIGKRPSHEALICSPFHDIIDYGEENQTSSSLIPIADDGFVFFKSEKQEKLNARFGEWCEEVLSVFLMELAQNL